MTFRDTTGRCSSLEEEATKTSSCFILPPYDICIRLAEKGLSLLGLGDFYFEPGVVPVERCLQTRDSNGGTILLRLASARKNSRRKNRRREKDSCVSPIYVGSWKAASL